jgi:transcriptional regulator with XRE-family HTH domain
VNPQRTDVDTFAPRDSETESAALREETHLAELGELLREAREQKGLSIAEVEERTKIRQTQIQALEEGRLQELPDGVYRKGLLRNYALFLGLDLKEVMSSYGGGEEGTGPSIAAAEGFEPPKGMVVSSWLFIDLFLGALIVGSVVAVVILAHNRHYISLPLSAATPTRPASLASPVLVFTPTNTATPTSTPTEIPSGRLQVDVQITARTWLEVAVDGEQAFRGLIEAGTNWSWFAQDSIAMHIGNAGGALVTLNGQELGTLGEQDEVVDVEWTWEALHATAEPTPSGTSVPQTPTAPGTEPTSTPIAFTPVFTATAVITSTPSGP